MTEAEFCEQAGECGRALAIGGQCQHAGAGPQMRT